jgi:hypothetical protein
MSHFERSEESRNSSLREDAPSFSVNQLQRDPSSLRSSG